MTELCVTCLTYVTRVTYGCHMTNAAAATFTKADVEAFAAMLAPYLTSATPEDIARAARAAWVDTNDEMARQNTRVDAYVEALMGTYDEFRAEAAR